VFPTEAKRNKPKPLAGKREEEKKKISLSGAHQEGGDVVREAIRRRQLQGYRFLSIPPLMRERCAVPRSDHSIGLLGERPFENHRGGASHRNRVFRQDITTTQQKGLGAGKEKKNGVVFWHTTQGSPKIPETAN